jgi:hypothetical protein
LLSYRKVVNSSSLGNLPICAQSPQCTQCRAGAKRVFARRSKQKAKLKIANLQQESTMLENQLDHQEEICDKIWADKLAYDQSIEELLQERELLRQQMNI